MEEDLLLARESKGIAGGKAGNGDFNLVRYFLAACLGVFFVLTLVMCTGFYYITKGYIRLNAEQAALPIVERLEPIAFAAGRSLPAPGTPEYSALDQELKAILRPLGIIKIKIYDLERRIVYTTDPRIVIGRVDQGNNKLERSLEGGIVSVLQTEESVWDLDEEERIAGAIVETYVAVPRKPSGEPVQYVFEIYQDVSATYARLPGIIGMIVGASVLAMSVLYGTLFLLVRKADQIIRQQTRMIKRAQIDLEKHATELERRVTERTEQLRESILQQQQDEKMVAIGTLAAGIAHELNTPLGTILASTQMVLDHCPANSNVAKNRRRCDQCGEDLRRVESQAKRCREIIKNLVGFSRKSDGRRSRTDLADIIGRSLSLVELEARESKVTVEFSAEGEFPAAFIDENEIQQVLLNIMSNGIAAMPDGGTLSVRAGWGSDVASVRISDTGEGIDPENLPRIFEPFFTTKEPGVGTGLGLSISYRIVRDHGGQIYVSSEPGKGTTFTVELPLLDSGSEVEGAGRPLPESGTDSPDTRGADR